jgi:hypothetical protein
MDVASRYRSRESERRVSSDKEGGSKRSKNGFSGAMGANPKRNITNMS